MPFELIDYGNNEELFTDVINIVKESLAKGLKCTVKKGLLSTNLKAVYLLTGEVAFECSYFRYGGFILPGKSGIVGVLEPKSA